MKTPWWSLWSAHNEEFKPRLTPPLVRENHCLFEMLTMKILYMPVCLWTRGHISRNTVLKCSPWRAAARLLLPDECEDKSIAPTSGSLVAESSSIIRRSRGDRCVETHMHKHSHWQWPPRDHHLHAKASDISPPVPSSSWTASIGCQFACLSLAFSVISQFRTLPTCISCLSFSTSVAFLSNMKTMCPD